MELNACVGILVQVRDALGDRLGDYTSKLLPYRYHRLRTGGREKSEVGHMFMAGVEWEFVTAALPAHCLEGKQRLLVTRGDYHDLNPVLKKAFDTHRTFRNHNGFVVLAALMITFNAKRQRARFVVFGESWTGGTPDVPSVQVSSVRPGAKVRGRIQLVGSRVRGRLSLVIQPYEEPLAVEAPVPVPVLVRRARRGIVEG
jgi:hypothetical protein